MKHPALSSSRFRMKAWHKFIRSSDMGSPRRMPLAALVAVFLSVALPKAWAASKDGASLYSTNCAYCHGSRGAGDGPSAATLRPKPADLTALKLSKEQIAAVVRDGKGSCPKWRSSLSVEEIGGVADYARSLQK